MESFLSKLIFLISELIYIKTHTYNCTSRNQYLISIQPAGLIQNRVTGKNK